MIEGKNTFTIEYKRGMIKEYEKQILSAGICTAFLPMGFLRLGEVEKINYDTSGYRPIGEIRFLNSHEMLTALEGCVQMLLHSCEHLLDPKRIHLNAETVYWSLNQKQAKIAFVPKTPPSDKTVMSLFALIVNLREKAETKEMYHYLKAIEEYIESTNDSLQGVLNHISALKREIFLCGWHEESRA